MKKTFATIMIALLIAGCAKEEVQPGKIGIMCQFDELSVDLNVSDNPYVTCVVDCEAGLERIEMFVVRNDGSKELYKTPIVSFNTPTRHSIYERPVYSEDMSAFRIVVTDKGGGTLSRDVLLHVTPLVTSPEVVFGQESIAFSEGDAIPAFSFTVTAKAELTSVRIELIQSGTPVELIPDVESFESPMTFSFNSTEHFLTDYDVNKTPTAVRVTAYDSYGKIGQSLLRIDYKALPSPEVTLGRIPDTDEWTSCSVSGSATSENGLESVSFWAVGDKYESFLGTSVLGGSVSADFSWKVDGTEVMEYLTGIKVVVKDARNKSTTVTAPLTVNPKPLPVAADENLSELLSEMSADEKYRSIKLLLAPGAEYSLGSSSLLISKTLKLSADTSRPMPTVGVGASYAFITDNAVVDEISFEGIHFKSIKSGSGVFNNTGGCSIGRISVSGCRFDGSFSTTFLRASGGSNIGSIELENNELYWANTSGTYSLFHITQSSDRIASLSIRNCTIGGVFYLVYCNMGSTSFSLDISNNTFVNQKGSSNGYFISCTSSTLTGSVTLKKNLFGGTNNVKAGYRVLRANKLSVSEADNWCTKSWKTFTDDATNGSVNPLHILPDGEDNADIFVDAASMDFTLRSGTSVHTSGIGDPRWIK